MAVRRTFACFAFALGVCSGLPAVADEPKGDASATIQRIRERGVIYAGFSEGPVPFSFIDANGGVQGYSWELCGRIADGLRETLASPALKVVPVPLTPSSGVLSIRTGLVDMDCGALANTPARARQIAFSRSIYVATVKVLVKADSPIKTLQDLDGKRIVTTLASGAERYVKTANAMRNTNPAYVTANSHAESLALVDTGKADAFVLDEVRLAEVRVRTGHPESYRVLAENLSLEPFAIGLPPGDEAFRQVVDGVLAALVANGEVERLYGKWFTTPALPGGVNLDLPMSTMLKEALRNP